VAVDSSLVGPRRRCPQRRPQNGRRARLLGADQLRGDGLRQNHRPRLPRQLAARRERREDREGALHPPIAHH
jgi:hypothetical protein